ncbi:ATP-binding protein [Mucilaginibacter sp.]|uniref:sensor histidine kinase n=1 Tax=Mucilaginibacter sp. TaxID=1882438 RepID=UPI00262705DD|nr:ATP-binding protein [Mucilaginibacter sp.]
MAYYRTACGDVLISAASTNGLIAITVKDNGIGIGIAADKLDEIFDFTNASTRDTGNESGTGLGLLLCREFIEINGGTIQVQSKPGEGSAFTITLKTA